MKFQDADEMLHTIQSGIDLYNVETGDYVFCYSNAGAIAVYRLSKEEAANLAVQSQKNGEYWDTFLGIGGRIYDTPGYKDFHGDSVSSKEYCESNYNQGKWVKTDDFTKQVQREDNFEVDYNYC